MDLSEIDIFSVLEAPTQQKFSSETMEEDFDLNDFSVEEEEAHEEVVEVAQEEPYDARREAEKLVGLLDAGNQIALNPLAMVTLRKKLGGKKAFDRMTKAFNKKMQGEELSPVELGLIATFEKYQSDLRMLAGEIPFTEQQRDILIKAAIPMCEENKMKTNSSMAFWGVFLGYEAGRVTRILTV